MKNFIISSLSSYGLYVLVFTFLIYNLEAQHIITFFIKPAKLDQIDQLIYKISKNPRETEKLFIKKELSKSHLYAGIYAVYGGYLTYSDLNGEIMFKRRTNSESISLLVTQDIMPRFVDPLKRDLVSEFVLMPHYKYKEYLFNRKINLKTNKYYWEVSDISGITDKTNLGKYKKIGYNTIILFANPDSIKVPIGILNSVGGENLVLPDLFVKPNLQSILSSLKVFKRNQYFKPISFSYKFQPTEKLYETQIKV